MPARKDIAALEAEGKRMQERMLERAGGGFDPKKARAAVEEFLVALRAQAGVLARGEMTRRFRCPECNAQAEIEMSPKDVAQMAAYCAKVIDELTRLTELVEGRADSRIDVQGNLLEDLTDVQLDQLESWLRENREKRGAVLQ